MKQGRHAIPHALPFRLRKVWWPCQGPQPHLTWCKHGVTIESDSCCWGAQLYPTEGAGSSVPARRCSPRFHPQAPWMMPSAFSIRHRLEPYDPASGRKVPHPRPLKPREMSQQHQIHRCLSLLCLKELVTSNMELCRLGVLGVCSPTDVAFTRSPLLPLRIFLFSFLSVPAGERLK